MTTPKAALKRWQRWTLYGSTALLWLTGALWLYLKHYRQVQGDYGVQANPAEPVLLEIHGALAMAFLLVLGSLWVQHVPVGWKQKKHRPSGVSLLVASAILIITGWGLYYVGDRDIRRWTSLLHWELGLASPILLFMHVRLAKRR